MPGEFNVPAIAVIILIQVDPIFDTYQTFLYSTHPQFCQEINTGWDKKKKKKYIHVTFFARYRTVQTCFLLNNIWKSFHNFTTGSPSTHWGETLQGIVDDTRSVLVVGIFMTPAHRTPIFLNASRHFFSNVLKRNVDNFWDSLTFLCIALWQQNNRLLFVIFWLVFTCFYTRWVRVLFSTWRTRSHPHLTSVTRT